MSTLDLSHELYELLLKTQQLSSKISSFTHEHETKTHILASYKKVEPVPCPFGVFNYRTLNRLQFINHSRNLNSLFGTKPFDAACDVLKEAPFIAITHTHAQCTTWIFMSHSGSTTSQEFWHNEKTILGESKITFIKRELIMQPAHIDAIHDYLQTCTNYYVDGYYHIIECYTSTGCQTVAVILRQLEYIVRMIWIFQSVKQSEDESLPCENEDKHI